MKIIKHTGKIMVVVLIIAVLTIPVSAFAATLKRGNDFWYSTGNVSGETFAVDGNTAYCVNPLQPIPGNGNYTPTQLNNDSLMKVLYYGYGSIGFNNTIKAKMDSYHNNQNINVTGKDLYYGLTRRCAAKAYGSNYKFSYYADWNNAIDNFYAYVQALPKPSGCTLKNDPFTVSLDKKDESGKLLAGAQVQLLDSSKKVVAEWTTTTEPYVLSDELVVGETYTYHEVKAPDGYKTADDITFTFEGNRNLNISMTDFKTETQIRKTDITGSQEIAGATLTVTEADNLSTVIDEWVSETAPHVIKGLVSGKSYVLTEKIPAEGYVTANSITFTVNTDGSVTEVTMKDEVTKVEIIKVDSKNQPLAGVKLQILDDKNSVVVPTWTTDGNPYRVDGKLIVGKTYRLHEVSTLPNYKLADDVEFTVLDTAEVQTVKMVNTLSSGSVTLKKRNDKNGSLAGSQWQLFTADDKAVSVIKTGNGIYQRSENSQLKTMDTDQYGNLRVGDLPLGDYYFVETKAADGTMPYAKKVTFTVSENTLNPEVTVKDYKTVMYNTGSIGITPFYLAGAAGIAAIAIGTGVYLFIKKKYSKK